jgi:hypothetical protein
MTDAELAEHWYEPYVSYWEPEEPSQFARALAESLRFYIKPAKLAC